MRAGFQLFPHAESASSAFSSFEKRYMIEEYGNVRNIVLPIALLASVGAAVFWILARIEAQINNRLASALQAVVSTTDKALQNWAEQTELDASVLASNDQLLTYVEAQLRASRDRKSLLKTPTLA